MKKNQKVLFKIICMTMATFLFMQSPLNVKASELNEENLVISDETNAETIEDDSTHRIDPSRIKTLSPEEMEKRLNEINSQGSVIYSSDWGEDAQPDWSAVNVPDDVYVGYSEDDEPTGTLIMKANVHEDIMKVSDSIVVIFEDADGNIANHALTKYNGFNSSFTLITGEYKVTEIRVIDYEDEIKYNIDSDIVTIEPNAVTEFKISIAPVEKEVITEAEPEPIVEKKNPGMKIIIGTIIVIVLAVTAFYFFKKKSEEIN